MRRILSDSSSVEMPSKLKIMKMMSAPLITLDDLNLSVLSSEHLSSSSAVSLCSSSASELDQEEMHECELAKNFALQCFTISPLKNNEKPIPSLLHPYSSPPLSALIQEAYVGLMESCLVALSLRGCAVEVHALTVLYFLSQRVSLQLWTYDEVSQRYIRAVQCGVRQRYARIQAKLGALSHKALPRSLVL